MARSISRDTNDCLELQIQALFETMRFEECKALVKGASVEIKTQWGGRVAEALREHSEQERLLY
jgi:hypothetical protein